MRDFAPHQTPDYVEREFDRSDDTLGPPTRSLPADDPIAIQLGELYVKLGDKHPCRKGCRGSFWLEEKRDVHEGVCGA